ncbi:alpha/beta fold hydrolase [Sporosarcina obsidiansis]|uniref:alpha/beta fold hydrolase n=1 Tax=Sporosarcina obsidiansis TaxID=2660748 RepID=UPI00129A95E3|nr:alpha/beta hydrolase [Sporosarcina obsidiansis]
MSVHYKEYGNPQGELLMLIHGGGVDGWMWDQQITHFSYYHLIVPTLQGHGVRNEENSFSIHQNAVELLELLEQKQEGKLIHIVGFSIGAQICLEMISLAPNFIQSAMVNSALLKPMKFAVPFIKPTIKLSYPLIQNRQFAKQQAKQLYVDKDYFEQYYMTSLQMKPRTLIEMLRDNLSFSQPDNIANSTTRILATVGTKEPRSVRQSASLLTQLNNCQSLLISDIGHGFPIAQPKQFNQLLSQWIQGTI